MIPPKKSRFKLFKKYKFDRWIFKAAMFIIFGVLFLTAYFSHFDLDYFRCGDLEGCRNPFYNPVTWRNAEWLPAGEYGTPPTTLFNNIWYISFGILALAFIVNHFVHNKGYDFGGISDENNLEFQN